MGCVYDDLAPAWLLEHCTEHKLRDDFDKAGGRPDGRWQHFADANLTERLTKREISIFADTPGKILYTNPRWHLMQCNYYWREIFRSHLNSVTVEGRYHTEPHVKHCGEIYKTFTEPSMIASVALKSSSPDPPDFEIKHLKDLRIDAFEFLIGRPKGTSAFWSSARSARSAPGSRRSRMHNHIGIVGL